MSSNDQPKDNTNDTSDGIEMQQKLITEDPKQEPKPANKKSSEKAKVGFSKKPNFTPKKDNDQNKTTENPFDTKFNWNTEDPFLGVKVDYGYVSLSLPEKNKNEGFYFMYPCKGRQDAPVLVTLIGGPGMCVVTKAFGRYNPLKVSRSDFSLLKTSEEEDITDRYHLLYIESPVGSGFSICTKTSKVQNFKTLASNAVEVMEAVFEKYPEMKQSQYFFNGESFCGMQLPHVAVAFKEQLGLDYKGMILETCVTHPDQVTGTELQFAL